MSDDRKAVRVPYAKDRSRPRVGDPYDRDPEYVIEKIHWDEVSGYSGQVIVDLIRRSPTRD
jgi:hypothetical protein